MDTPWGHLKELDLRDSDLCASILAQDKHQLAEGLVVENIFDQIIEAVPSTLHGAVTLDIETAIAKTGRHPDQWHAFVWARSQGTGLGRYLKALTHRFRTWLVTLDDVNGVFIAREFNGSGLVGESRPLVAIMSDLSGRRPTPVKVAPSVRDARRQKLSFWGFLVDIYGDQLGSRVILPRLFLNHGIQPWFNAVWNLDRILVHDNNIWMLEIKHKFPFRKGRLSFGINDGELGLIRLLGEAGIRCFHAILAKPSWTKNSGSGYLLNRLSLKERAALIGVELDERRISAMFGARRGLSPDHTSFPGDRPQSYRSVAAADFVRIGLMSESVACLAGKLGEALAGKPLPRVTDRWLLELKAE